MDWKEILGLLQVFTYFVSLDYIVSLTIEDSSLENGQQWQFEYFRKLG